MLWLQKAKTFAEEIGAELEKEMADVATVTAVLRPTSMIEDALRVESAKVDKLREIEKALVEKMNVFGKELAQARHMLSIYEGAVEKLASFPPPEAATTQKPAPDAGPAERDPVVGEIAP